MCSAPPVQPLPAPAAAGCSPPSPSRRPNSTQPGQAGKPAGCRGPCKDRQQAWNEQHEAHWPSPNGAHRATWGIVHAARLTSNRRALHVMPTAVLDRTPSDSTSNSFTAPATTNQLSVTAAYAVSTAIPFDGKHPFTASATTNRQTVTAALQLQCQMSVYAVSTAILLFSCCCTTLHDNNS